MENVMMHYGVKRRSGRYKYGSGKNPYQGERQHSQRKISEMPDDELRTKIARMELERKYSELQPRQVSAGHKFMKTFLGKMVEPAAQEIGRQVLRSFMSQAANKAFQLEGDFKTHPNNKKK